MEINNASKNPSGNTSTSRLFLKEKKLFAYTLLYTWYINHFLYLISKGIWIYDNKKKECLTITHNLKMFKF